MRLPLLLALLPFALLTACNRSSETVDVAPATTVAEPATVDVAPAADTVAAPVGVSEAPAPGEHTNFDAKAFAGEFSGAGTRVGFTADGAYTLTSNAAGVDSTSDGTWTLEPDQRHVRLDPNHKAEDHVYEVVSMDELRTDGGETLRRGGMPKQQ